MSIGRFDLCRKISIIYIFHQKYNLTSKVMSILLGTITEYANDQWPMDRCVGGQWSVVSDLYGYVTHRWVPEFPRECA